MASYAERRGAARLGARLRKAVPIYLLVAPAVIWFIIFVYYPSVLGIIVSFQRYRLVGASEWIGFANYVRVFHTPGFWRVVWNTMAIGFPSLIVNLITPLVVALLLNEIMGSFWKKAIQTSIYIAYLFSWVVVAGIWIYVLAPDKGILNMLLSSLGIRPLNFMSSELFGRPLVVFLTLWKEVGYLSVLYLAGIAGINPELYESAVIDGAGRFRQAISITVPSLVPTIKVLAILGITGVFRLFDPIWVLRNGGNLRVIDTIMIYLKQFGIDQFQIGYTSAISTLLFGVVLAITLLTQRVVGYKV